MTKDEYCINVCGAKCCTNPADGKRCPRLGKDSRCTIYKERYRPGAPEVEAVALYVIGGKIKQFYCGQIETLLAQKQIAPEIAIQCVYAHPELLEKYNARISESTN